MSHDRRRSHASISAATVSIAAIRWPVCQTPPRVVTHQIGVENPSRATSRSGPRSSGPRVEPPAHPDVDRGHRRVDDLLPGVGPNRPDDRDQRSQGDRRKRREGDRDTVCDDHVVPRPERVVQPDAATQESIGQLEEIGTPGVKATRGDEVDRECDHHDGQADDQLKSATGTGSGTLRGRGSGTHPAKATKSWWLTEPRAGAPSDRESGLSWATPRVDGPPGGHGWPAALGQTVGATHARSNAYELAPTDPGPSGELAARCRTYHEPMLRTLGIVPLQRLVSSGPALTSALVIRLQR
jgi:hypothetical protein